MKRVVVIGTGLAGTRVAARLGGDAVLIGEEPHAPYNRVLLAEVLAGSYGPEVIRLPTPEPKPKHLQTKVTELNRSHHTIRCENGAELEYETLILATGANPVLPPLRGLFEPGATALPAGVHAFRTMDDCVALSEAVREGPRAVVIGGGLLGVSAARALARRGAQVVLVQQAERLMERHLDPESSALVAKHLTALGVEIHTECRVKAVGTTNGKVSHVELHDGYVLDTDVTVLACGARPRTGLAKAAGLEVRRGIVVDDELRTSDPHIHAVGDCAEHAGRVYGLATPALEQADALANVLTGEGAPRTYSGTRTLTRLTLPHAADPLDLAAFGETEPLPGDDVVQLADATRGTYRRVVVRGDRLVGGVLVGALGGVGALAHAWESNEALPADDGAPLLHLLTHDGGL
ncbi:FAD-dependent oxidoreductase [Streptomyces sp. NPDC046939]|uniref:NAD(P)/FAD-dependent oxidoreductase n=1 Tax=Streptomyces sp. NPDC046939 TaxID=3155376 RepID=UPI00340B96DA